MALAVIEELSKHDGTQGTVVVESDKEAGNLAMAELDSIDARKLAITYMAGQGLPDPRINGTVTRYPVDSAGNVVERPKEQKTFRYRADVPVTRRLV